MKIRSRLLIRTLARVLALMSRTLFATVRTRIHLTCPGTSPYDRSRSERYLYCVWHDSVLPSIFSGRCPWMAALVSQHADGSYVADALDCVGITPVRGSSSRGGAAAVRQMMDSAADKDITIATDGPRGPKRVVKEGIVYLASQTGRAIIPVAYAASQAWRPRGKWTDLIVPKPFSRGHFLGGEPMLVPSGLSRDELRDYRHRLQRQMDALNAAVERLAAGEEISLPLPSEANQTQRQAA